MSSHAKMLPAGRAEDVNGRALSNSGTDSNRPSWLRRWPPPLQIAVGVLLGILAAVVTSSVGLPDTGSTYILLYPVVFLCAYLAGRDSGVSAAGAGALIFLVQLVRSWAINPYRYQHLASLILFTAIGSGTALLLSNLKRARTEAEAATAIAIDSRNQAQRAHDEADLLLRELSHRVKNDVANLVAILRLQAGQADEAAAAHLLTAADRMIILSRVHQRLSRHGHQALVELRDFLEQLCSDLDAMLLGVRAISLTCDVVPLQVPASEAVAIGLIVNEMLTNAVKYAFPDGEAGKIHLSVGWLDPQTLEVMVRDTGKGLNPDSGTGGLGRRLIGSLTAQLNGSYECHSDKDGTECVVRFPSRSDRSSQ